MVLQHSLSSEPATDRLGCKGVFVTLSVILVCLRLGSPALAQDSSTWQQPVYPVVKAPPAEPRPAMGSTSPGVAATPAALPSQPVPPGASELELLAQPIALHPDPLLAVILPASVYPLEIVQAARFVRDTNNLTRLAEQPWDDKVKAVAQYPEVIAMMNDDIDWTTKLGQAFLNQPLELMNAIQSLRGRAQTSGALKTTPQQVVTSANAVVERMYDGKVVYVTNTVIEVRPASTNVLYVPTYNPSTVYVDDNDGAEAVIGFGVALGMTAIIANNCDWYYGGCYWGHYPPPPPHYPPPYHPPPGTPPPTGGRPPGERPPGDRPPGDRPPSASTLPAQRWQPDQNRLSSAGAPATAQSREARGWGGASAQPAQRDVAGGVARQPSASVWQPAASTRAGSPAAANRSASSWSQSGAGRGMDSTRATDRSASSSLNRTGARSSSAFSDLNSGSRSRDFSSRGATSRAGGARGGGRSR